MLTVSRYISLLDKSSSSASFCTGTGSSSSSSSLGSIADLLSWSGKGADVATGGRSLSTVVV